MVSTGCSVGGARVIMSTLLKDARIGDAAHLHSCLVGKGAVIGDGCRLDGVVVDHGANVPEGTVQEGGAWPQQA